MQLYNSHAYLYIFEDHVVLPVIEHPRWIEFYHTR